jgi:ribosome-associated protein
LIVEKFYKILKKTFHIEKARKATKPSKSAVNERIKEKKVRSNIKQIRNKNIDLDD